jgi:hypothetical protein
MENFNGAQEAKGVIARFDRNLVEIKFVKTGLKGLEMLARTVEVDMDDNHVIAKIEFSKPINTTKLSEILSVGSLKPTSIESFEVGSDTEEEKQEVDFEIPKKRSPMANTYDLSIQGQDLESYQRGLLVWLAEEFKKIEIQSKSRIPEDLSSEEDLSSQESEFSDYESESESSDSNQSDDTIEEQSVSCDEEDFKVLRENVCESKGLAELNLKKICVRTDENLDEHLSTENLEEKNLVHV